MTNICTFINTAIHLFDCVFNSTTVFFLCYGWKEKIDRHKSYIGITLRSGVIFSLLSLFRKNKIRLMKSPSCLCVSLSFFLFYAVLLVSKESRLLILPRTSCFSRTIVGYSCSSSATEPVKPCIDCARQCLLLCLAKSIPCFRSLPRAIDTRL
jgi:hypothetical protein